MLLELVTTWIVQFVEMIGYTGIFILMALESTIFPIPSETVMPFAGFLITTGTFTFLGVILASTLGSLAGSLFSYYLGKKGGYPLVKKFGKYLLLDESHLAWTEEWFGKYGEKTIFISRFVPVVRHFISIPAGVGEMNLKRFLTYTALGALAWNSFLTYIGIVLKNNWTKVQAYSHILDIFIIILLIIALAFFLYVHLKRRRSHVSF